jgi:hypothetical protein
MKKYLKYILFSVLLFLFLSINVSKTLAAECILANQYNPSGSVAGAYCTQTNGVCSPLCSSGWRTWCNDNEKIETTNSVRCYIKDADCTNTITCNKCVPQDKCTDLRQCGDGTYCGEKNSDGNWYCNCSSNTGIDNNRTCTSECAVHCNFEIFTCIQV